MGDLYFSYKISKSVIFLEDLFCLFQSQSYREGVGLLPADLLPIWHNTWSKTAQWNSTYISHVVGKDQCTWDVFHCFPVILAGSTLVRK